MAAITERTYPGEFLLSEAPGTLSRDTVTVTVPAATTYAPGTVLGVITASGKHAMYDNTAEDGTQTAKAVLFGEAVNDGAAAADVTAVVINWGAEVRSAALTWGDEDDAAAGLVDLASVGIKAR